MHPPSSGRRPAGRAPFLPAGWWRLPVRRRRQVAAAVALALLLIPLAAWSALSGADTEEVAAAAATPADDFVAGLPPARVALWDRLAECESGGDWSADTGNGFFGGVQFTAESWVAVGGTGSPAAASRNEQIMRAEMLVAAQGWGAWPNCSRELGLL